MEHRVTVIDSAVGDIEATIDIQAEGDLRDGEGTRTANILARNSPHECVRIPILVATLDSLLDERRLAPTCPVMKIDTDGYDLKLFQGGVRFLEAARPAIFGEFSAHCMRWHGQTVEDVLRLARNLSYVAWRRERQGAWQFSDDMPAETFSDDLLLVPSEVVDGFEWCRST